MQSLLEVLGLRAATNDFGGHSPVHNEGLAGEGTWRSPRIGSPAQTPEPHGRPRPRQPFFSRRKESVRSEVRRDGAELGAERAAFPPVACGLRDAHCRPSMVLSLAFLGRRLLEGTLCLRAELQERGHRRRRPEAHPQGQPPRLRPVRGAPAREALEWRRGSGSGRC